MIQIENLFYTYPPDNVALRDVSLSVSDGDFIAIMGQNGAGKTTLIKHLNGLLKPQRGSVLVNGLDTRTESVARLSKVVGFVFQNANHSLFAETVEKELEFTLRNFNVSPEEIPVRAQKVLTEFDLVQYRTRSPFSLSGGEQKRLALAAILCVNPPIIVLDEPTIGQDSIQKRSLANLLGQFVSEKKTVIIVTHDIEFVAEYIPRTLVMSQGQIIADGPTDRILTDPWITEQTALRLPEITQLCRGVASEINGFPMNLTTVEQGLNAICSFFDHHFKDKRELARRSIDTDRRDH
ncbi:MAG: energy-coupling factor ABC transporter ATP-binding protein [Candidatus Ranarchaeia archaeon]